MSTDSSGVNSIFRKKNTVSSDQNQTSMSTPLAKKKRNIFKPLYSLVIFLFLAVGSISAFYLTQINQDVRQQASGCVYWNGEAASEDSYDNRGGIRQQCVDGLWTVPDDGNLDPSQIVAQQEANRPKRGCVNWQGESVKNGAIDNRGGIRQQCVDGIWTRPADGNLDPSELIAQQQADRENRECVSWDGSSVSHGAYDNRGGIRQQCVDGLWSNPDDNITNPNQVGAIEVSSTLSGLQSGELEYQDSIDIYNEHCRSSISPGAEALCDKLDQELREEAEYIRWSAYQQVVQENIDQVSFAIGGLDEGELEYSEALEVYSEYCEGATLQKNSVEVCDALDQSLNIAAAEIKAEALQNAVEENNSVVSSALRDLETTEESIQKANQIYQQYCQGSDSQQTSVPVCQALQAGIEESERRFEEERTVVADILISNVATVKETIRAVQRGIMPLEIAEDTYQELCRGAISIDTTELCLELDRAIADFEEPQQEPLNCFRLTDDSCKAWSVTEPSGTTCSDLGDNYFEDSRCGIEEQRETIFCYTSSSGCYRAWVSVVEGTTCADLGHSSQEPASCSGTNVEETQQVVWWNPWTWQIWSAGNNDESETDGYTCYEVNGGQCYEYTTQEPCSENPYTDTLSDGSCDNFVPQSVVCNIGSGADCQESIFEGTCPSGYNEGFCPEMNQSVSCYIGGGDNCVQAVFEGSCPVNYTPGFCPTFSSPQLDDSGLSVTCYYDFREGGCREISRTLLVGETCADHPLGDIQGQNTPC